MSPNLNTIPVGALQHVTTAALAASVQCVIGA